MSQRVIVLGRIDEPVHQAAASIVELVLRRLDHPVIVFEGPSRLMYRALENGELDLLVDARRPDSDRGWRRVKDRVVDATGGAETVLVHVESWAALPERERSALGALRFTGADLTQVEGLVTVQGLSPLDAARCWLGESDSATADLVRGAVAV